MSHVIVHVDSSILNPGGLDLVKSSALDAAFFVSLLFTAHKINCAQVIN
jgi:hypothetical protein